MDSEEIDFEGVIDAVEQIRSCNNVNWMNILRIAFRYAPDETLLELKRILDCDRRINEKVGELFV